MFNTLSRVKCLKNNSCLKYCRQHLLKTQVERNSMVTQVKKATFQRMRSGGKGRTENEWGCVKCRTVCTIGSISYISTVSTSRSQRMTVRGTTDLSVVTPHSAVLLARSVFSVTLHLTSCPSRVNTNCHSPVPCPLPVTAFWDLIACLPIYTASH